MFAWKFFLWSFFIFFVLLFPSVEIQSAMQGGNYEIYADSFSAFDGTVLTGGAYSMTGTGGEQIVNISAGGSYEIRGGFQAMEKGILSVSLDSGSVNLGTLSKTAKKTDSLQISVSTDSKTGYMLSISEDGDLRSGVNTINDVLDGAVSVGEEEYGISVTGSDSLVVGEIPIIGAGTQIASSEGPVESRVSTVEFAASIDAGTAQGTYGHSVVFTATVIP